MTDPTKPPEAAPDTEPAKSTVTVIEVEIDNDMKPELLTAASHKFVENLSRQAPAGAVERVKNAGNLLLVAFAAGAHYGAGTYQNMKNRERHEAIAKLMADVPPEILAALGTEKCPCPKCSTRRGDNKQENSEHATKH